MVEQWSKKNLWGGDPAEVSLLKEHFTFLAMGTRMDNDGTWGEKVD